MLSRRQADDEGLAWRCAGSFAGGGMIIQGSHGYFHGGAEVKLLKEPCSPSKESRKHEEMTMKMSGVDEVGVDGALRRCQFVSGSVLPWAQCALSPSLVAGTQPESQPRVEKLE